LDNNNIILYYRVDRTLLPGDVQKDFNIIIIIITIIPTGIRLLWNPDSSVGGPIGVRRRTSNVDGKLAGAKEVFKVPAFGPVYYNNDSSSAK